MRFLKSYQASSSSLNLSKQNGVASVRIGVEGISAFVQDVGRESLVPPFHLYTNKPPFLCLEFSRHHIRFVDTGIKAIGPQKAMFTLRKEKRNSYEYAASLSK
jgi:hypothetical protein